MADVLASLSLFNQNIINMGMSKDDICFVLFLSQIDPTEHQ